jgi:hypothetical protein
LKLENQQSIPLRKFLAGIYGYTKETMSGDVSLVLMTVGAILWAWGISPPWLSPFAFWLLAYPCLLFAAFRLWKKQEAKIAELGSKIAELHAKLVARLPLDQAQFDEAKRQLKTLSEPESRLVREVLVRDGMIEDECGRWCEKNKIHPAIDIVRLKQRVSFLTFDICQPLQVKPAFRAALGELLLNQEPGKQLP